MTAIKASAMALIIATIPLYSTFNPADHELVSESPTGLIDVGLTQEQTHHEFDVVEPAGLTVIETEKAEETESATQEPPKPPTINVIATHYTASCEGCLGITKNGTDVRNTIYSGGKRIIAVDPDTIPLNSTVQVTYEDGTTFKAVAADVGGKIKQHHIDVLVASESEAYRLGRQQATVTIINGGR